MEILKHLHIVGNTNKSEISSESLTFWLVWHIHIRILILHINHIKYINLDTHFILFQEDQITSIIKLYQQTGRNDLVKEQIERIDRIRKIAKDYSEVWCIKKCEKSTKIPTIKNCSNFPWFLMSVISQLCLFFYCTIPRILFRVDRYVKNV